MRNVPAGLNAAKEQYAESEGAFPLLRGTFPA
jgi:hypothetical protein